MAALAEATAAAAATRRLEPAKAQANKASAANLAKSASLLSGTRRALCAKDLLPQELRRSPPFPASLCYSPLSRRRSSGRLVAARAESRADRASTQVAESSERVASDGEGGATVERRDGEKGGASFFEAPQKGATVERRGAEKGGVSLGVQEAGRGRLTRVEDSDEEVTALMEGVSFAQLCDDFECVSSPAVERTARLLARDIHDIREDKRSLSCFAIDVKYKDPLRSFVGRERYRRPSWILNGLDRPRVSMIGMEMLSTSVLVIRWRLRGDFRVMPAAALVGASLDLLVTSTFTLNQISGQVLEHRDEWDLTRTPLPGVATFFASRLAWTTVQSSKDLSDSLSMVSKSLDKAKGQDGSFIYPDPSGDPRKFFVQDDPNKELYQFAFLIALLYLLVQFLRLVI